MYTRIRESNIFGPPVSDQSSNPGTAVNEGIRYRDIQASLPIDWRCDCLRYNLKAVMDLDRTEEAVPSREIW